MRPDSPAGLSADVKRVVAERLRETRELRGMTLYVAALSADLTTEDLVAIEAGERTIYVDEVVRLADGDTAIVADVYGVSLDYLCGMADPGWVFHLKPTGEIQLITRAEAERFPDPPTKT